ncbi:hydroxypyruvate isomerase family protein [Aquirufa antheringensis]|jgi:hydroxypyruvate isomerase|uniref:Hydroxypyruvate isomerase n=1 Tax=Aquirufa antheringensis TaxID=2516559 RepID=A0A4Q9B9K8_9BACT|nr:TIM barrel protein [Aquirufa antheringensis]MCZ2485333.1 TIM barrel protein [Aquirufa antheringensis]MCZ2488270.1 TIM barrel protein [Aquirufa antheringensis]MCZ2490187.1 TIM barrel protein [Aquirufa antheringensis]TBH72180.1 hydroxypyruvate isomerase [Aquirufa antheringensis]
MENKFSRRDILKSSAGFAGLGMMGHRFQEADIQAGLDLKGKVHHSACRWCYQDIPFEELVINAKKIGLQSIELTGPDEWEILKKHDMTAAIGWGKYPDGMNIPNFFNRTKNHDALVGFYEDIIPKAAKAGVKNIITFSGNRDGMSDEDGLINCKKGLQRIMKTAERYDVTISMELLNSKVNHKDYQADTTEWGAALCEMVGSDKFKLLYDIYHMQIMEGDVIATIKKYHQYISHYHTGGVPGRNEIDETQELNYAAIIRAIYDTGYKGFIGQEFIPARKDKMASLEQAVKICDI